MRTTSISILLAVLATMAAGASLSPKVSASPHSPKSSPKLPAPSSVVATKTPTPASGEYDEESSGNGSGSPYVPPPPPKVITSPPPSLVVHNNERGNGFGMLPHVINNMMAKVKHAELEKYASTMMVRQATVSTVAASKNYNRNRYGDISPYDYNLVTLTAFSPCKEHPEEDKGTTYIHASDLTHLLDDFSPSVTVSQRRYIMTQAPTSDTIPDFWKMIYQQKVNVIVMLTRLEEGGNSKAENYWDGVPTVSGLSVTKTSDIPITENIQIRTFELTRCGKIHRVTQFHYTGWPDQGVPNDYSDIFTIMGRVNIANSKSPAAPVVVHCSAGVGRAGSYVTLERAIALEVDPPRRASNDDVVMAVAKSLRRQRMTTIQKPEQLGFVYSAFKQFKQQRPQKH